MLLQKNQSFASGGLHDNDLDYDSIELHETR